MNLKRQKLKNHPNKLKRSKEEETFNEGDMKLGSDKRKKRRRRKRSHSYIDYGDNQRMKKYPSKLRIKFTAFQEHFVLILKQNDNLFSNDFSILEEGNLFNHDNVSYSFNEYNNSSNGGKFENYNNKLNSHHKSNDKKIELNNCYYQGFCMLHPNSSAAISMCEGMVSFN